MRPRRLSLTAFGPFAGREEIDFSRLRGHDLVLIEGPTGAGKTSVLDAMCFALFGVVPGARREVPAELRSGHADPSRLCEVVFEFELGARSFRVRRVPAQERAKVRGQGTTRQPAEAQLVETTGGVEVPLCAARVHEVDAKLRELLGLEPEQFRQVLLLPQGEFRQFLLAPSVEKEKLLEDIFGTTLYRDVAARLRDEKERLEREAEQAMRLAEHVLGRWEVGTLEELDARIERTDAECAALHREADEAAALAEGAQRALAQAEALKERFDALALVERELGALAREADAVNERRRRLERAERAEPLGAWLAREEAARDALDRRLAELGRLQEEVAAARAAASKARARAEERPAIRAKLRELAVLDAGLAELESVEREVLEARRARETEERAWRAVEGRVAEARARLERARAALRRLEERLAEREIEADEAVARTERARELAERAEWAQELSTLESRRHTTLEEAARHETEAESARREHQAAEARLSAARRAREANLAAELAAGLVNGVPCPVCGAREHPSPARPGAEPVTPADVAAREAEVARARRRIEAAERAVAVARAAVALIEEQTAALRARLGEEVDAEAIARDAEDAGRAARRAQEAVEEAGRLRAERTRIIAAVDAAERELAVAEKEEAAARARAEHAAAREGELVARLAGRVAEGDTVAAARERIAAEVTALEGEVDAREREWAAAQKALAQTTSLAERFAADAKDLAEALETARAALEREARARGFADAGEARLCRIPQEEVAGLRAAVAEHDRRMAACVARRAELTSELEGKERPDVARLEREVRERAARAAEARVALGRLEAERRELVEARRIVAEKHEEYRRLDESLRRLGRLAQVVSGDNPRKMSLGRFVLAHRMEEVLEAASRRLVRMSRGRYVLRRTDESRRGRASGLDLEVEDRHGGMVRSVHSLSGGEMFMASLSLALGLADVITRRAGGVRIDSLFIDEGFGTLDDETLDQVIRTLEELRVGGRLVGVISHVAELKERIPTRISVRKGERGSSVALGA